MCRVHEAGKASPAFVLCDGPEARLASKRDVKVSMRVQVLRSPRRVPPQITAAIEARAWECVVRHGRTNPATPSFQPVTHLH